MRSRTFHHLSWRWLLPAGLMLLGAGLFVIVMPSEAQDEVTITIDNQVVSCSSMTVTYTITNSPTTSVLVEAENEISVIGDNDGPGFNGQNTATVTFFSTQPSGTMIRAVVSNGFVTANGPFQPCDGGGEPPDVPTPTPDDSPPPDNGDDTGGSGWGGDSDGRLNPDPAEYYAIWCHFDRIDVYRGVPQGMLLKLIPLVDVIALPVGGVLELGDGMDLVRENEENVTIYGDNGNRAPEPGSKSFSLNECIADNGGVPEIPPDNDQPPPPLDPPTEEDPRVEAQEALDGCYFLYEDDGELLAECLNFVLDTQQEGLTGNEIVQLVIMIFCFNIIFGAGVAPIGLIWFSRRLGQTPHDRFKFLRKWRFWK